MLSKQAERQSEAEDIKNSVSKKDSIPNEENESKMRILANHLIDRVLEKLCQDNFKVVLNSNKENSILIMEHNNFSV